MTTRSMMSEAIVLAQQEVLHLERQAYLARVADLMRFPERAAELNGYLHLIDNINQATMALARSVGIHEPGHGSVSGKWVRKGTLAIAA